MYAKRHADTGSLSCATSRARSMEKTSQFLLIEPHIIHLRDRNELISRVPEVYANRDKSFASLNHPRTYPYSALWRGEKADVPVCGCY
jgi:hypothetical protein